MSLKKFILLLMVILSLGCGGSHGFNNGSKCVGMLA
jgi:hypothetical protein